MKSEKKKNEGIKIIIFGGICLLVGLIGRNDKDMHALFTFLIFGGAFIALVGLIATIMERPMQKQLDKQEEQEKRRQFYLKCKSEKVTSLSTPIERQKAELIANALGINMSKTTIDELYVTSKKMCDETDAKEQRERLTKQRSEEREDEILFSRYSQCVGRDKRVTMLSDLAKENREISDKYYKGAGTMATMGQQKEKNWALNGGLVSGLAGGAAGLAAAANTQIRNAEIRAQNERNRAMVAPTVMDMLTESTNAKKRAEAYEKDIINAKTKVVFDISEVDIWNRITMNDVDVAISETGAFLINVTANVSTPFDDIEGRCVVIDGTIEAALYQDNQKKGTAMLVLPMYGMITGAGLTGMCCGNADASKEYEVSFQPHKLWVMEA